MSGRAGRRGKDDRGICIIMVDEKVTLLPVISLYLILSSFSILIRTLQFYWTGLSTTLFFFSFSHGILCFLFFFFFLFILLVQLN